MPSYHGRNEGEGGTTPRASNHFGDAESLQRVPKRLNNVTSTFFNTVGQIAHVSPTPRLLSSIE